MCQTILNTLIAQHGIFFHRWEYNRAVFVVEQGSPKGTSRCGQEFVNPLLVFTGKEYEAMTDKEIKQKIKESIC